eukprot:1160217-Pelagomonas_calceolata.AAC.20
MSSKCSGWFCSLTGGTLSLFEHTLAHTRTCRSMSSQGLARLLIASMHTPHWPASIQGVTPWRSHHTGLPPSQEPFKRRTSIPRVSLLTRLHPKNDLTAQKPPPPAHMIKESPQRRVSISGVSLLAHLHPRSDPTAQSNHHMIHGGTQKNCLILGVTPHPAFFLVAGPVFFLCLPCFSQSELRGGWVIRSVHQCGPLN